MDINKITEEQKRFFGTGKTLDVDFRIATLKRLKNAILRLDDEINQALK